MTEKLSDNKIDSTIVQVGIDLEIPLKSILSKEQFESVWIPLGPVN
jgi:hypothetical protein